MLLQLLYFFSFGDDHDIMPRGSKKILEYDIGIVTYTRPCKNKLLYVIKL